MVKRKKNNEAARKSRDKRRNYFTKLMDDAKDTVAFNSFIRGELLTFYEVMNCPVPTTSMLFVQSEAKQYIGWSQNIFSSTLVVSPT